MPVPYRKTPQTASTGSAAYLDILWLRPARTFYGALLLMDERGQPQEFVHNTLSAPAGFLWPEERVRALGLVVLSHSLFDACRREPDLLVCRAALGSPEFCRAEIAPSIPFAQVAPGLGDAPGGVELDQRPSIRRMSAHRLAQELLRRGFALEPFARLREGLRELYPQAPWEEANDDTGAP